MPRGCRRSAVPLRPLSAWLCAPPAPRGFCPRCLNTANAHPLAWLFCRPFAVCGSAVPPTDRKKPTNGVNSPPTPLFRTRWAVAPPRSLPCRVGSLSASLRCHPLRLEGVGFLVVRGKGSGLGSVQPLGGRLEAVALLAGVILEGVGLGGEFAVE